jgi:hypothetical protein
MNKGDVVTIAPRIRICRFGAGAQDAAFQNRRDQLSASEAVHNNFNLQRHLASRNTLRDLREEAFRTWQAATAA